MHKIEEMYAFVAVEEQGEGIIGQTVVIDNQLVFMPFVCADKARMESLKPLALKIHMESGKKIKVIKMTKRTELEEIG
jgi:hypothetical protein